MGSACSSKQKQQQNLKYTNVNYYNENPSDYINVCDASNIVRIYFFYTLSDTTKPFVK